MIEWTGERCVPWAPDVQVVYEHVHRYLWAAELVQDRRVLDLGSGEGFGAAILAERASTVAGVDVDDRTVEHARLNYAGPTVSFHRASVTDLSLFEAQSFDVVVAFEVVEHVDAQELMLTELKRVLTDDGFLIISTPDRWLYTESSGQHNPFHEHELSVDEFESLLRSHFSHVSLCAQRTITGSHLGTLESKPDAGDSLVVSDFFIERSGDEWKRVNQPAALYVVAVASNSSLPSIPSRSTLGDCSLELMRSAVREMAREAADAAAARDRHSRELQAINDRQSREIQSLTANVHNRDATVASLRGTVVWRDQQLQATWVELEELQRFKRRVDGSVTWQLFQGARRRLYWLTGEDTWRARMMSGSLRLVGRAIRRSGPAAAADAQAGDTHVPPIPIHVPMFREPEVSLIIPLHARPDLTRACLESIVACSTPMSYEIILIDDAADEGTKQLLAAVDGARIIVNDTNVGYLRSVNHAAELASGKWLVLCNNDIIVHEGWLAAMLDCGESASNVGIVTPRYIYPDGALNEAGGIIWSDGTGVNFGRWDDASRFHYRYRREVDYGSAAALLVRTELWRELGGFDERYIPMYYEDTDLCFAARTRGWRVLYEPTALVTHLEGGTAGTDPTAGPKRHQEENRVKFVAKWREQLDRDHMRPTPSLVRRAANRHRGPHVLLADHRVPTWDQDSGSLRMYGLIRALLELGARVTFMPDNFAAPEPYTSHLERMGVEVMHGVVSVSDELAVLGPSLSLVVLSRPAVASRWLELVRKHAPAARLAYDTVDLHWLREARRKNPTLDRPSSDMPLTAVAVRELELALIRAVDVTFAVTEAERQMIQRDVPGAEVLVVPNVHELDRDVPGPNARSGVLFVGGFDHDPNREAAIRLVREVMPLVWRELGDVPVTIAGSEPPPEIRDLASASVEIAGWVEELGPLLRGARAMVAPLTYGAGLKGKVTQSLAAGLPVVTTPVGAEGLDAENGRELLVAEDPHELAKQTIAVLTDDALWLTLSRSGQELVDRHCAPKLIRERLAPLLDPSTTLPDPVATRAADQAAASAPDTAPADSRPSTNGGHGEARVVSK